MKHLKAMLVLFGLLAVAFPAAAQKADPPKAKTEASAPAPTVDKDTVIHIQSLELAQKDLQLEFDRLQQQFQASPEFQSLQQRAKQLGEQLTAAQSAANKAHPGYTLNLQTLTYEKTPPAAKAR